MVWEGGERKLAPYPICANAVDIRVVTPRRTAGSAHGPMLPDPDDLAGLVWYYWRAVEAVRSGDAPVDEKRALLAELERRFRAARGPKMPRAGLDFYVPPECVKARPRYHDHLQGAAPRCM